MSTPSHGHAAARNRSTGGTPAAVVAVGVLLQALRRRLPHLPARFGGRRGRAGAKALHIVMEARPGREADLARLVADIGADVADESTTRPWFGVRRSRSVFGIFETFPNEAGRLRHLSGHGTIRLLKRSNALLRRPAQIDRLDVIAAKPG